MLASALRRLTHDIVVIGRPGAKAEPEVFVLKNLSAVGLANLLIDSFQITTGGGKR